jgi:DNA repair protein RecN (Recombination protein N)
VDVLENGQGNINDQLRAVINQLSAISKYQPELADYIQRLESTNIELKDITRDLDDKASATVADPARSENIQTQLNSIYRLQKKHGCNTLPDLISLRDSLGEKLLAYVNSEATIETLKKERDALFVKVSLAAKKLSEKRAGAFEQLEKSVHLFISRSRYERCCFKSGTSVQHR